MIFMKENGERADKLKLSVITINYNDASGLQDTLESVVQQLYQDYELIVIDGGSTDGSVEMITKFKDHISYWVSEPDKGIYAAMNKGLHTAKGEYCFFLNSGDTLVDNSVFENIFRISSETDIIQGNLIVVDGKKKNVEKCKGTSNPAFLDIYNSIIKHQASFIQDLIL